MQSSNTNTTNTTTTTTSPLLLSNAFALLPTVSLLLREECVEQSRAVLGYFRVCVNVLPPDELTQASGVILPAIFEELGALKPKFTSRVRGILRKLIKRYPSTEALRSMIPEADQPLFEYIQRRGRRESRKKEQIRISAADRLLGSDSEDR